MKETGYLFLAVFLFLGISGCASQQKKMGPDTIDDAAITAHLRAQLANDAVLHLFRINVDTREGLVTLSGAVPTVDRKKRASEIATQVVGVRGVENLLEVAQARRVDRFEDAVIASKITSGLIQNPMTHSAAIDVEAKKGIVTLSGRVLSPKEKREAERIAWGTAGVVSVENQLEVLE